MSVKIENIDLTLPEGKKLYFASDFHLGSPSYEISRRREARIVKWLNEAKHDMGGLFLLGDVFDYWFEYKYVMPKNNIRLLGKLAELSDAGIPIYFFHGNHDAWMREFFERELNMHVVQQLARLTVRDTKIIVGHGDGLGPGQTGYKIMKAVFKAPVSRVLFAALHPRWAHILATNFSRQSRKADASCLHEQNEKNKNKGLLAFMHEYLKTGKVDAFIFAHRHWPVHVELEPGVQYVNTGDWIHYDSYVTFDGTALALHGKNLKNEFI